MTGQVTQVKLHRFGVGLATSSLLLLAACSVLAPGPQPRAQDPSQPAPMPAPAVDSGPSAGSLEVSIGGLAITPGGNDGFVNGALSVGWYASSNTILSFRHIGSFSDNGEDKSFFTDRIAVDFAAAPTGISPFIGVGIGMAYGESVNETVLVGVHAGARAFIKPSTFLQLTGGYDVFFTRTEDETEIFDDAVTTVTLSFGVTF